MKNILSYGPLEQFTGLEVKEWIQHQIDNDTSKKSLAIWMQNHFPKIVDNHKYRISLHVAHEGDNHKLTKPFLERVREEVA